MVLIASPEAREDVGMHECEELANVNTQRSLDEMPLAFVFFDYDKLKWTWKDYCNGETFTEVEHCPFCDQKLSLVIELGRFYWLMLDGIKTIGQATRSLRKSNFEIYFWLCGHRYPVSLQDVQLLEPVEEKQC